MCQSILSKNKTQSKKYRVVSLIPQEVLPNVIDLAENWGQINMILKISLIFLLYYIIRKYFKQKYCKHICYYITFFKGKIMKRVSLREHEGNCKKKPR